MEAVEGVDLAVFVDGGEEVLGPRGWMLGEGVVESEGGVELKVVNSAAWGSFQKGFGSGVMLPF